MPSSRHAAACFLAMICGFWAPCAPAAGPASPVIRVAVAYAPKSLDPATATDAAGARLLQLTHPALLTYDASLHLTGLVARACVFTAPQAAVCTLTPGRRYHSGNPLTAASVAQWLSQLQANPKSPLAGLLKGVTVSAPAPQTVAFALPIPQPGFLDALAQIPLADPTSPTAGLGTYRVTAHDDLGNTTLTPSVPGFPILQFLTVADPTTRLLKLQKGEADVAVNDLPPELTAYAQKHGLRVLAAPGSGVTYLAYNFRNPDLANPILREALAQALDRPLIRQTLLGGLAAPAGSLLPPGGPATWEAPEEAYDPKTANETLDETMLPGPDGTRAAFTLATSTDPLAQRLAQVIQQQWARIGVRVTIRPTEWAALYDAVRNGRFDIVLMSWTGLQTPDFLYQVFDSHMVPPMGFNRGHVADDALDATLEALHNAPTPAQQTALAVIAQQRIARLRPYLMLFRRAQVLVMGKTTSGCTINPQGSYTGLLTCRKP
jgi:peptide/nickel transport system substrate-binding protein